MSDPSDGSTGCKTACALCYNQISNLNSISFSVSDGKHENKKLGGDHQTSNRGKQRNRMYFQF